MRRSHCGGPGYTRRRRGTGFEYLDPLGRRVDDPRAIARFQSLVIPPAWHDVWICPYATGHIQAIGTDEAGRRQYIYHEEWRESTNAIKHQRVLALAAALPGARRLVSGHLRSRKLDRNRALAAAFRILDQASLRVGSEQYAVRYATFGLATLMRDHSRVLGEHVEFAFPGKGSQQIAINLRDRPLARVTSQLVDRKDPDPKLLAWIDGAGTWHHITSTDVNSYIREITGGPFSAKDFRTWNATVLMAVELSRLFDAEGKISSAIVRQAVDQVAAHLCNTPAVARSSYIDRRVIELFEDHVMLPPELALRRPPTGRLVATETEAVVLEMLQNPQRARRKFSVD